MNIVGVAVSVLPEYLAAVEAQLVSMSGVEVHAVEKQGKMVVTVEAEKESDVADILGGIQILDGVLSAAMVYHSFSELESEEEGVNEAE